MASVLGSKPERSVKSKVTRVRAESYGSAERGRAHSQSQVYLRGDPVDPTRAHFRAHRCSNRRCFSSSVSRTNCGNRDHTLRSGFSSALETDCRLSLVEEIVEEIL